MTDKLPAEQSPPPNDSTFKSRKNTLARKIEEESLMYAAKRDMTRLWREGWKFAAPYVATANGALALVAVVGIGLGIQNPERMELALEKVINRT